MNWNLPGQSDPWKVCALCVLLVWPNPSGFTHPKKKKIRKEKKRDFGLFLVLFPDLPAAAFLRRALVAGG